MTYQRPAYEEVTIAHGGSTVTLRPSLRAAATLESKFGFAALVRAIDEANLTIIYEIILAASSSRQDAAAFLSLQGRPLSPFFASVRAPLAQLLSMFLPASEDSPNHATGKPVPFSALYSQLYSFATGWLHWTPEQTWRATPTEISRAISAHVAMLNALNGVQSESDDHAEQAERNIAEGYDPEFNRAGLNALKAKYGRKR